jgi:ribose 5-phosphate isomerase B
VKKNSMTGSPEIKKPLKDAPATSPKKDRQDGPNSNFPQEYEEQLSTDIRMTPQPLEALEKITAEQMCIGIAADHGGFELKKFLVKMLSEANYEVIDFGDRELNKDDDYPDFVIPLADAIANGKVERGIAICGSGVGASIAANKVDGVRGSLITEKFSARQGVEDDNMNMICLGGRVISNSLAGELVNIFLKAKFSGAERHNRRLAKVAAIEKRK